MPTPTARSRFEDEETLRVQLLGTIMLWPSLERNVPSPSHVFIVFVLIEHRDSHLNPIAGVAQLYFAMSHQIFSLPPRRNLAYSTMKHLSTIASYD